MRDKPGPVPRRETLGARLVSRGVVTQAQVDEAVEAQVIFGGRIGTNLLELGYVDEETLTAFLAEQHKVPGLPAGVTDPEPEKEALGLIPTDLVKAYRVLPLRLEGKRLHVLMENPSDLSQIDELAFRTGFIIKPQVATEARMAFLLERYFGIRRATRYVMLSRDGERMAQDRVHESIEVETASMGIDETHWETDEMIQRELEAQGAEPPEAREVTAEEIDANARIAAQGAREAGAEPGTEPPGAQGHPAAPGAGGGEARPAALPADPVGKPVDREALSLELTREFEAVAPAPRALSVDEAIRALGEVEDRDDVARILLDFCRGRCRRAGLFILRGSVFLGWGGSGEGVDVPALRALKLPADAPSVLQTASTTGTHLIGTLSDSGYADVDTALLSVLGGGAPEAAVLFPLVVKDRVVAVLYADNGPGMAPPEGTGEFLAVVEQVPKAFSVLLRKRRAMVA